MNQLKKSDALDRLIRQDAAADLGISDWTLIRQAIDRGSKKEALDLLDYAFNNYRNLIDSLTIFRQMALTEIAAQDENQVQRIHRARFTPYVKSWLETTPGVVESLQRFTEAFRGIGMSDFQVIEEPDRYVMVLDPCGTGGRLRRAGNATKGVTKTGHPWSWSKTGVPYYCTHCCTLQEVLPIEARGYPICVTDFNEDAGQPCRHLYYKKPELIPDEYFTRIGQVPFRLRERKQ